MSYGLVIILAAAIYLVIQHIKGRKQRQIDAMVKESLKVGAGIRSKRRKNKTY